MFEKIEIAGNTQQIDFRLFAAKYFLDYKKPIKRQPVALSMGETSFGQERYPIPFGSYGDFSCLVGASKSMKTFLKTALVASYIGGNSNNHFEAFRGHNTEGKFILDIDTEQSPYHAQRAAKRVSQMVGHEYPLYKPFALREESPKNRFDFIEWLVNESEYKNNIGLLTIDGAADLMEDVNDLKASNKIAQAFMRWTTTANCHLITVLHRNHGTMKPMGHLGSAILKKAETVAFVERGKDAKVTRVTPEYTRNYPFREFGFELSDNFLPVQAFSDNIF
ncbi:MAG: AAA family ATPase [Flavobacteriaceae bacterium]|nr:AAA family ATPase [Flavobacteriaceae bacterium]